MGSGPFAVQGIGYRIQCSGYSVTGSGIRIRVRHVAFTSSEAPGAHFIPCSSQTPLSEFKEHLGVSENEGYLILGSF